MIILTRLGGDQFAVNPDLIERIEATPDTVLTLVDGTKYVVLEPLPQVVEEIRDFRASIIAAARHWTPERLLSAAPDPTAPLAPAVPLHPVRRP